jgi:YbaB/EbfC DNA-binding family
MPDEWKLHDIDAAEDWLDAWVAAADARASAAAQLTRQVAAITAVARNDDGTVAVTVGSNGQLEHLDLDDRVRRLTGRELSAEIMSVLRSAQRELTRRVAAEVRNTVGDDSATGRAVIDAFDRRFPAAPPEPAEGGPHVR